MHGTMVDSDVEKVKYMHPNRGQHPVYGAQTGRFYGHRSGGGIEEFLVERADIAATPQYFHIISPIPSAPQISLAPPPEPKPIALGETPALQDGPEPLEVPPPDLEAPPTGVAEPVLNAARFDMQLIPGINKLVAENLAMAGINSVETIKEAGVKGLLAVKWVGTQKARLIYAYVMENYG